MPALRTRDTRPAARRDATAAVKPIAAPAPRAFTFPATHNLGGSPYSSPSNSPFEDTSARRARALSVPTTPAPSNDANDRRTPPPLSAFTRTLWPQSVFSFTSSSLAVSPSPLPGKSPRRPKKGDKDYIKRPENAFILFRRKCSEDVAAASSSAPSSPSSPISPSPSSPQSLSACVPKKKPRQADLSKLISQKWKALPAVERAYWEDLARERKMEHEMRYPDYVYRPRRSRKTSAAEEEPAQVPPPPTQLEVVFPANAKAGLVPYQSVLIPHVHLGAGVAPGEVAHGLGLDTASFASLLTGLEGGFDYLSSNGAGIETSSDFFKNFVVPPPPTPCLSSVSVETPPSPPSPLPPVASSLEQVPLSLSFSTPDPLAISSSSSPPSSPLSLSPSTISAHTIDAESATYTPYSPHSHWSATSDSPWAWGAYPYSSSSLNLELAAGDFDLAGIPDAEFGLWATTGGAGELFDVPGAFGGESGSEGLVSAAGL